MTNKSSSELSLQEKCLLIARHEYPDAIRIAKYGLGYHVGYDKMPVTRQEIIVCLDHQTIGPLIEKYRICLHAFRGGETWLATKDRISIEQSNLLDAAICTLIDYWYPTGITEEMLK